MRPTFDKKKYSKGASTFITSTYGIIFWPVILNEMSQTYITVCVGASIDSLHTMNHQAIKSVYPFSEFRGRT